LVVVVVVVVGERAASRGSLWRDNALRRARPRRVPNSRLRVTECTLGNMAPPRSLLPRRRTHPSTRLIEEVLESVRRLGGMGGCRAIIVADGVKVGRCRLPVSKPVLKAPMVSAFETINS
jgi:hypothetical protein